MEYAEIDWNEAWKNEIDLWHNSSGKSCKEYWNDKKSAAVYSKKYIDRHQERAEKTLKGLGITPESNILDIGAGPGNLALPMAEIARSVTTIEPSLGMNAVMETAIKEAGATNIIPIEKTWEDVDPDKDLCHSYDIIVASMSLGMRDIRAAIEKMNQVCCGTVNLIWHVGIPQWEDMPKHLWPKIFNKPYHGGPKSDILFQVLYQMGIYPRIQTFSNRFKEIFPSLDAALTFYCKRFEMITPPHFPLVEAYLKEKLLKTDQGFVHEFEHGAMQFSWEHTAEKTAKRKVA